MMCIRLYMTVCMCACACICECIQIIFIFYTPYVLYSQTVLLPRFIHFVEIFFIFVLFLFLFSSFFAASLASFPSLLQIIHVCFMLSKWQLWLSAPHLLAQLNPIHDSHKFTNFTNVCRLVL